MSRRKKSLKESDNLIKEIKRAELDVSTAEKFFAFVSDPELVDIAIYDLEAKKTKYSYLIRLAKEKGIRSCWSKSLV